MRFISIASLTTTVLALSRTTFGTPNLHQRQVFVKPLTNVIIQPTVGSIVSGGGSFPFNYTPSDFCHNGFSSYTVWVVPGPDPPTAASLNSTQEFSYGDYLASFGLYRVADFPGLPLLPPGPPPPTFIMPVLDESYDNSIVFLTVVETVSDCPPIGITKYGLSSVGITYTD